MMKAARLLPVILLAGATPPPRGCDGDPRVVAAAAAWHAKRQQPPLALSLEDAVCFRDAFVRRLDRGPVIGYKVGVYTAAARRTYRVDRPAIGTLTKGMITAADRPVSARFGYAGLVEPDFILVVGSPAINSAVDDRDLYRHLRGWRPFIELPDNHYPPTTTPDFARLTALDLNARGGTMAAEVPLPRGDEGFEALENLSAEVSRGDITQRIKVADTLGSPIQIVRAARDLLLAEGKAFKAGDVISIGTIAPAFAPIAGETTRITYRIAKRSATISLTVTQ